MMRFEAGRDNACENYTNYMYEENLCQFLPAKLIYDHGETVTFKFSVKSKLAANGKQLNIYNKNLAKVRLIAY